MLVEDARLALREAREQHVQSRVAIHTFKDEPFTADRGERTRSGAAGRAGRLQRARRTAEPPARTRARDPAHRRLSGHAVGQDPAAAAAIRTGETADADTECRATSALMNGGEVVMQCRDDAALRRESRS